MLLVSGLFVSRPNWLFPARPRKISRLSFRADVNMRAEPKGPMFWECFRARVRLRFLKNGGWKEKTWKATNSPRIEIHPEVSNLDIYKQIIQIH